MLYALCSIYSILFALYSMLYTLTSMLHILDILYIFCILYILYVLDVLHYTILYYTILYYTIPYHAILYNADPELWSRALNREPCAFQGAVTVGLGTQIFIYNMSTYINIGLIFPTACGNLRETQLSSVQGAWRPTAHWHVQFSSVRLSSVLQEPVIH